MKTLIKPAMTLLVYAQIGTILTSPNKVLVNKLGVDTGYGGTPNTGVFSRVPMCNATRIADKLKASVASGGADMVIGAIGVGLTPGGSAEQWLEQDFVTDDLYKAVAIRDSWNE